MNMRDKIADVLSLAEMEYQTTGEGPPLHAMADIIVAAMPEMIEPLVWTLYSPDDQPHWEAKGYSVESRPRDTWYFMGICYNDIDKAKAAANAHHRAAIMAAFKQPKEPTT